MAQIPWQTSVRDAQILRHWNWAAAGQRPVRGSDPMAQDSCAGGKNAACHSNRADSMSTVRAW